MFRIVQECKPDWVVGENVAGFVNMALDDCAADLERVGYEVWPLVVPACAVNAPHRRDRCWIVAHAESGENDRRKRGNMDEEAPSREGFYTSPVTCGKDVSHARLLGQKECKEQTTRVEQYRKSDVSHPNGPGCQKQHTTYLAERQEQRTGELVAAAPDWSAESPFCRVADGLPAGLDGFVGQWDNGEWPGVPRVATGIKDCVNRLKGLGNAIVPQVAYEIFKTIVEVEHEDSV
jgi:DNA (cytosine-5)-methyltransferase 1